MANKGNARIAKAHIEAALKEIEEMIHENKSTEMDALLSEVISLSLKTALYSTAHISLPCYNNFSNGADFATSMCKYIDLIDRKGNAA